MLRAMRTALLVVAASGFALGADAAEAPQANGPIAFLGSRIEPGTFTRRPLLLGESYAGEALTTPVLVAHGAHAGPTLCLTSAVHGDEVNGIEVVRRILYGVDVAVLRGSVIGVPVANPLAFDRGGRETPDRRDLNRYFPGKPRGSLADRVANALWAQVVTPYCTYLVDLHTGSFHRSNIPQLRANLEDEDVRRFAGLFDGLPVVFNRGNPRMLRRAATEAGIPAVNFEFGAAATLQIEYIARAERALRRVLVNLDMLPGAGRRTPPRIYRKSFWLRAEHGGLFIANKRNGEEVAAGEEVGAIVNPLTEERHPIHSAAAARILGIASDQFVLPGYGVFHLGIEDSAAP